MNRFPFRIFYRRPEIIFWLFLGFLLVSYTLILLIDVHNIYDLRDRWYSDYEISFFWYQWFVTPVEMPIQWVTLSAVVYGFFLNARTAHSISDERPTIFWRLMGLGAILMVLEDIYDIRHRVRDFLTGQLGSDSYGVFGTFFELGYFALLGGVLLYAFFRYRDTFWEYTKARNYLIAGYVFYAIAAGSSWAGSAFQATTEGDDLYTAIGRRLTEFLFFRDQETKDLFEQINEPLISGPFNTLEFYFVDSVYEESLELLGAGALVVAAIAFHRQYRSRVVEKNCSDKE